REGSLVEHVDRFIALRAKWLATEDMDERARIEADIGMSRSFRSSSEPWPGTAEELVLAAVCVRSGDQQRAHALIEPLLAQAEDVDDLIKPRLMAMAKELDRAMLEAFAHARDYDRAIALARRILSPELAHWGQRERALELLDQLPRRRGDFAALQLPTPERWRKEQAQLSRDQQIAWLVARLGLLSCQQWSNPGWLDYSQTQVGAPLNWVAGPNQKDERINPFTELLTMNLAIGELPALLPALESRDYILAFDCPRFDFLYPMSLHRVSWVAATVVNEVCQEGVVDPRSFVSADEGKGKRARAEFVAFCQRHAGERRSDRLAARMTGAKDWQDVRMAFWRLYEIDKVRACATMLARTSEHPATLPQVVRLFCLLDRTEFVGEARNWLADANAETRFFAAGLLLRHGIESERALAEIEKSLKTPALAAAVTGVVDALLACELPAARKVLQDMLAGKHVSGYTPTPTLVGRLWRAGWPEAQTALVEALAGERELATQWSEFAADDAEKVAAVKQSLASWWPDRFANDKPTAAAVEQQLKADWQRIQRGEKPTCRTVDDDLPWGGLRSYSTGWIRRM
ncbi:MAG: hypothetical protein VB934_13580, partial [Polyangiaceae bacterium]